jgi:hypothetical protein
MKNILPPVIFANGVIFGVKVPEVIDVCGNIGVGEGDLNFKNMELLNIPAKTTPMQLIVARIIGRITSFVSHFLFHPLKGESDGLVLGFSFCDILSSLSLSHQHPPADSITTPTSPTRNERIISCGDTTTTA